MCASSQVLVLLCVDLAQSDDSDVLCWQVSGEITYNGHQFSEFVAERTSAYIDQVGFGAGCRVW